MSAGTPFSSFQDGAWVWLCNWTWMEKPKPKKVAGKLVEVDTGDNEYPNVAAKVVGSPSSASLTVAPVWGNRPPDAPDHSQPPTVTLTPATGPKDPYVMAMQASNIEGRADMVELEDLKVGELMHNLRIRYQATPMAYYTYVQDILIVCNPMKPTELISEAVMREYQGKPLKSGLPPHIYAIGDTAFRRMLETHGNQSIVISGESGAGKSESTKHVLEYLAFVSSTAGASNINNMILATSEVLEAFGNSKTKRNHNSSRFGKFVEVQFDQSGSIQGAIIDQYLLEKSRIVEQEAGERNYHIFYMMLDYLDPATLAALHLGPVRDYRYLIGKDGANVESYRLKKDGKSIGDDKRWANFLKFMGQLHLDGDFQRLLFEIVAAILHLGQVEFYAEGDAELAKIKNMEPVNHAAALLRISAPDLQRVLLERDMLGSVRPYTVKNAGDNCDALAKAIYGGMFAKLVEEKVNHQIEAKVPGPWIGVLDIFGFESFQELHKAEKATDTDWIETQNKFEQLCINLTNEQLQNFFYAKVIGDQERKYEEEGLSHIKKAEYAVNLPCIQLVTEGKASLFGLLDQVTRLARDDREMIANPVVADKKWLTDIKASYKDAAKNSTLPLNMRRTKKSDFVGYLERDLKHGKAETDFCVYHYAGQVWYTVLGGVERNKDKLYDDTAKVIHSSTEPFIASLLPPIEVAVAGKSANTLDTVAKKFTKQLTDLTEKLGGTESLFVRCVKPKTVIEEGNQFEDQKVLDQLICAGMYAVIEVRMSGYPYERHPAAFVEAFSIIEDDRSLLSGKSPVDQVRHLCAIVEAKYAAEVGSGVGIPPWQMGKTKVFLRDAMFKALMSAAAEATALRRVKQGAVVRVLKGLLLMRKELVLLPERLKKAAELEVWKKRKFATMDAHNCSPEEAEKIMAAEDEEAYRQAHLVPLLTTVEPSMEPVDRLVGAIDAFARESTDSKEKANLSERRSRLTKAKADLTALWAKYKTNYHDSPAEEKIIGLRDSLVALAPQEEAAMVADIERRAFEKAEAIRLAEERRLEALRLEAERREQERLAEIARLKWEAERAERERREKIDAERRRRQEEKDRAKNEAEKRREAVLAARRAEEDAEREAVEAVRRRMEARKRKEEKALKKAEKEARKAEALLQARHMSMIGMKVKYAHMLCEIKFFGYLPYESRSGATVEYVGLECPESHGDMNDGTVLGVQVMNVQPGRGKFVHPSCLHIVKSSRHKAAIGDLVWYVGRDVLGYIRYIGAVRFAAGAWVGLELVSPGAGKHNGTVLGVQYFVCEEASGVFVKPENLCVVRPWDNGFVDRVAQEFLDLNPIGGDWEDDDEDSEEIEEELARRAQGQAAVNSSVDSASDLPPPFLQSEPEVVLTLPTASTSARTTPSPATTDAALPRGALVASRDQPLQVHMQQVRGVGGPAARSIGAGTAAKQKARGTSHPQATRIRVAPSRMDIGLASGPSNRRRASARDQERAAALASLGRAPSRAGAGSSLSSSFSDSMYSSHASRDYSYRGDSFHSSSFSGVERALPATSPFSWRELNTRPSPTDPDHYIVNGWTVSRPYEDAYD